ncbi:MAG: small ribosomal subunit Rsm22 family protein [Ktedonobacteraceae bacterium]
MDLPNDLRLALSNELATIPQKSVATVVAQLSARYRSTSPSVGGTYLRNATDVLAYAAYRLPATFAAIYATLREVQKSQPHWQPHTLLDAGSGPGTALWAANEIWPDLQSCMLLERDTAMISMGKQLAQHARSASVQLAEWRHIDLLSSWESTPHDLVLTSYVLGELPLLQQEDVLNKLWSVTAGALIIIEPGTPGGFSHINRARQHLLSLGANILAPCPHILPCPMVGNDWCHFAQRISRTQLHRQVKQVDLSYEDEKFSYIAVSRTLGLPITGRVIRHPQIRPGHIHLEVCTPNGLKNSTVTRKDRVAFRQARDMHWGNTFEPGDIELA